MKDSLKLSCDLVRCPDTSFLKLIPNHRETKMAVVVGGAGGGVGDTLPLWRVGLTMQIMFL